jgi:uncharacterized repeat protein (TIGR01451 family)
MKANKKVLQIVSMVVLFLAVVGISIGFAMMSTQLSITGTAKVVPATWDIKFLQNYSFSDNDTDAEETEVPTITDTTITDYEVTLTKPGDKGTYLFTVKNNGTINAKVSTVTLGSTLTVSGSSQSDEDIVRANLVYNVTWSNGDPIQANDALAAGAQRDVKIEVEYSSSATQLPQDEVTVTGRDLTILFVQD